jgi:tetratricopeptide (TPR) repeat protein
VDADPFRDDVRDALLAKDTPRMVELVKRPVALEQPPGFATFLGEFKNIDAARRRELLLAAMLRRPSDVGVLFTLHNVAAVSDPVDWNENLRWSQAATAADPTNFAAYANLGVALRETGRPQDAITCTRRAIELDPTSSGAYLNLGNALDMTGQFEEALVSYRKAIELDPKDFENYCCMGRMLSEHGRTEEALEVLKKSIELNPKHAEAHYGMGVTLSRLGRWDEAMGSYLKTIELELAPKDAQAETNLAGVLYELGRHDEALVYCKKAVEDDPNHAGAFFNMGKFYAEQGPLEDAIANFRKAIELDPNYAEPHCDLAVVLSGQGDYEGALAEFRRAHELGSKRADWHYPSAEWIRKAEADAARAAKLPAFLNGEYQPSDNAERREFANMCQNKSLNYAATGIFAAVLAADPELGDRLQDPYVRYNAACVAVLSAAGRGKDAAGLSEDERARLRLQALGWLRADLNVAAATLDSGNRVNVLWLMRQFLRQSDLVSIRDPGALAKLPAEEQFAFKKLWDDAAALLKQAETKTPNAAHPESPPAEK